MPWATFREGAFKPCLNLRLVSFWQAQSKRNSALRCFASVGCNLCAFCYILDFENRDRELGGFAANGYGDLSPAGYSMISAPITELVLTFMFSYIILWSTHNSANKKFAGIAIGLSLTLIHLMSIPITNTSVNPARSISQALFAAGDYIAQPWMFILVPIAGPILAGGRLQNPYLKKVGKHIGQNKKKAAAHNIPG